MSTRIDLNQGALAAVSDEVDLAVGEVSGSIPTGLRGTLIRNGPNPLSGRFHGHDVLSWWPEAAMLHALAFGPDGVRYRNRWVRTQNWGKHVGASDLDALIASNPNVNVLAHAGEILALAEGGPPLQVTPDLETLGLPPRHPGLHAGMTAHPKLDPATGELVVFRASWEPPFLRYGVVSANGAGGIDQTIELSRPAMMHDCAITATRSILFDTCVGFDLSMLQRGFRMPLRWYQDRPARLAVLPRGGGDVSWFEVEPCFIQHVVNAYDRDRDTIIVEVVRYPWYFRLSSDGTAFRDNPLGVLWRYTLHLQRGHVDEEAIDALHIELPRINDAMTGHRHRYVYAVEQPSDSEMRGVVCYDRERGSRQRHEIPIGDQNSEAVFVADPEGHAEDDGWLLLCIYRRATDTSDVVVLDARDLAAAPLATVHLPRRIPAGFHGAFLPIGSY